MQKEIYESQAQTIESIRNVVASTFKEKFDTKPLLVRSPGRVNLIGEHTDYNEGFVLPAAIDKETVVAISLRDDDQIHFYSIDLQDSFQGTLSQLSPSDKEWPNYIMGVADQLLRAGYKLKGFNCVFGGNIPMGAGLSSSAALECATAFCLNELNNLEIDKVQLVKFAQAAENKFVGVNCGIMDQFISMFGKKNQVFKLDCRDLTYEYFPFQLEGIKIVLFDTQVKHSLASSEYNTRRKQCEEGVSILKKYKPSINSLRDVSIELLHEHRNEIDAEVFKRCEYVIQENNRLISACDSLKSGDIKAFGQRMYESHDGLSKKYEVSCPELDFLVEVSRRHDNVLGARMMGGGFGGCTINIVKEEGLEEFIDKVTKEYKAGMGRDLKVYTGIIENGTSIIN